MSPVRQPPPVSARPRPPHRVIIARGESIRTFTVRPWLIVTGAVLAVVVTTGYLGATGYLAFRDDLLATSIARQSSMQHAYEDRIAALRADIDRLTSRQLLNQQEVEAEVQAMVTRQAAISQRQDAIVGLGAAVRAAGIASPSPAPAATSSNGPSPATAPKPALKTSALLLPSVIDTAEAKEGDGATWRPPLAALSEVGAALDRMASAQAAYVGQLAASVVKRNDQIAAILKSLGRDAPQATANAATDVGGPYVPLPASPDPAVFRSNAAMVNAELQRYAAIRKVAAGLPLTVPVPDPIVTSSFGTRLDPFLGTPALHTGVDYRALQGQPVAATAPGTIVAADFGYNGGYGNMIDIDHGDGIVTRFGHLSEIDVKVGQVVAKGAIIGKAGATGRATGPHVHYELRVNDDPVDPMRYIAAGEKLLPLL
jgi:murein DD-endopeptidase MepM/ murein hydrolase activator NlpD